VTATDFALAPPHTAVEAGFVGGASSAVVGLNAPVRSLQMLDLQAAAGASEVYLALPPVGGALSFDGLPSARDGEPTQVTTRRTLTALVTEAHHRGLRAHFCADAPAVAPSRRDDWLAHARIGIEAGADTVVVGSLATLAWLTDAHPGVDVVAGGQLGVSTTSFARHIAATYGVRRIVLPHEITLDEIARFTALGTQLGVEIEVPVQTGSGLGCRGCRLADQPGAGLGCRAGYRGGVAGEDVDLGGFLDGAGDCALCDVPTLAALGVRALQVPGRESPNLRQNAKITQMYRRAVDGAAAARPMVDVVADIDRVELMWQMAWVPRLCERARCRFRDTPARRAYV
jgi:collagenase-like PrtC family protease